MQKDSRIRLHDLSTGAFKIALDDSELTQHGIVYSHAVSDDGRIFAGLTSLNKLGVWDTTSGRKVGQFDTDDVLRVVAKPERLSPRRDERPRRLDSLRSAKRRANLHRAELG